MPIPNKHSYIHGSTGTEPGSAIDYASGDPLDADNLDFFLNALFSKDDDIIDVLTALDSDGDGKVDAADQADQAANAAKVNGNDIDSNDDGIVDEADISDQTRRFEVRTNDPSSPADGQVWIRSDL